MRTCVEKNIYTVICVTNSHAHDVDDKDRNVTATLSPMGKLLRIRAEKTTKDADLVIKMTQEFVKDMRQKMIMVKRIQKTYDKSSDFTTGLVYSDIQKKFRRMCDLYKYFATVKRYILGYQLNQTHPQMPNPDVVVVYQYLLSDYDEIHMLIENFKLEQVQWSQGDKRQKSRELIRKQMEKFGSVPAKMLTNIDVLDPAKSIRKDPKPHQKVMRAKWSLGETTVKRTTGRWSGELDGVAFTD